MQDDFDDGHAAGGSAEDKSRPETADDLLEASLSGLGRDAWLENIEEIGDEHGYFQPLGSDHAALFIDRSQTLLITFEDMDQIQSQNENALPLGFDLVTALDWSHLCLLSDGRTWFRDAPVYGFFDRLVDEGFFDEFDRIVVYGAGAGGYAAAAFSVACPGATVIAIQPQATLDPRVAEWDVRFRDMRRLSFTDRYGYAPDMLDAAEQAFVFYDAGVTLDSMHAALFTRPNVSKIRLRHLGHDLDQHLVHMDVLYRILSRAGEGRLTDAVIHRLMRERRDYSPYLRNLLSELENADRSILTGLLCRNVVSRMKGPRFRRRLTALEQEGLKLPARKEPGGASGKSGNSRKPSLADSETG